jgi:phage terminase large subunit
MVIKRTLKIDTPRVFLPLLGPARYKGAYGGRGSGKSHFFAELLIEDCLCQRGMLAVCIREVQKSLKDSSKRLIEAKLNELGLGEADGFRVFEKEIQTPGDGVVIFVGLQDSNNENIKSLEGFGRAWIEEAQVLSHRSLTLLRPTIRACPGTACCPSRLSQPPAGRLAPGRGMAPGCSFSCSIRSSRSWSLRETACPRREVLAGTRPSSRHWRRSLSAAFRSG